jgi:hypothetical protein
MENIMAAISINAQLQRRLARLEKVAGHTPEERHKSRM